MKSLLRFHHATSPWARLFRVYRPANHDDIPHLNAQWFMYNLCLERQRVCVIKLKEYQLGVKNCYDKNKVYYSRKSNTVGRERTVIKSICNACLRLMYM